MDLVLDLLATVSRWSRGNLSEISLALVGCLLVLFGTDVKAWAEQRLGGLAGALRVPFMALMVVDHVREFFFLHQRIELML